MFYGCQKFNCDISNWDTSNVKDMRYMFWRAWNFNQDISGWDVSNCENFTEMFFDCPIKEESKPHFN